MEILWSIGLIVGLLLALNFMAGGRPASILNPVMRMMQGLLGLAINAVLQLAGGMLKVIGGSIKPLPIKNLKDGGSSAKPARRW